MIFSHEIDNLLDFKCILVYKKNFIQYFYLKSSIWQHGPQVRRAQAQKAHLVSRTLKTQNINKKGPQKSKRGNLAFARRGQLRWVPCDCAPAVLVER